MLSDAPVRIATVPTPTVISGTLVDQLMLVPVLVFLLCFGGAVMASARWLPDLAPGSVGGLAFFVVVGLIGAAAGVLGLHVYEVVRSLEHTNPIGPYGRSDELAVGVGEILRDSGTLIGLAAIVYLLAPADEGEPAEAV